MNVSHTFSAFLHSSWQFAGGAISSGAIVRKSATYAGAYAYFRKDLKIHCTLVAKCGKLSYVLCEFPYPSTHMAQTNSFRYGFICLMF